MRVFIAVIALQFAAVLSFAQRHEGGGSGIRRMAADWRKTRWRKGPRVSKDRTIQVDFALASRQEGVDAAEKILQAISDPDSERFGQHLSVDDVATLFAPSPAQIRETARWLAESGIPRSSLRISSDRGHVFFNTTVDRAERLLGAAYFEFRDGDKVQLASESLQLPATVARHVDVVFPGTDLGLPPSLASVKPFDPDADRGSLKARQTRDLVDCFEYMTPDCYRALYNMPESAANTTSHPKNSFGTYQPAGSTWLADDLDGFFARYQPELVGQRPQVMRINGGYLQTDIQIWPFNLESNLDHEYAMALARPQPVTNIQVGDKFLGGNLNTMLAAFDQHYCETGLDANYDPVYPNTQHPGGYNGSDCGVHEPPLVISVSYVWNEAAFSSRYLRRQCLEYLKLSLRGVSVIVSSGDNGPSFQGTTCINPATGEMTRNGTAGFFTPGFPASCPWVTTVGGTQLTPANRTWQPGTPWQSFPAETAFSIPSRLTSSGGGFSRVFPAPFYQQGAVASYLRSSEHQTHLRNLSTAGYFNAGGRGFPDVAAVANNVIVRSGGTLWLIAGTSASAPVFASMVARVNDARLKMGKRPVGFLNLVLYSPLGKAALRDVKAGWNGGCGVEKAFGATSGWDAVTGLGTPDYGKLLELYLRLP
ncbi:hypothetical protein DL771_007013 [Monosporascus sp. 5C6A]|nr:hypothetical protein DL771_007013 [Monosporascus sp. 5C6A]